MAEINSELAGKSASDIVELESCNLAWHELDQDAFESYRSPTSVPLPENQSQRREKPKLPADYQVEESTDDIRFALFNLFKDLYPIREHIDSLLERNVIGEVGLALIGAAINSAIVIVRSIETRFLRALPQPQFSSWEDVMSIIATPPHFQAFSEGLFDGPELEFLYSIYGLPFQQLQQFRDSLRAETRRTYPVRPPSPDPDPSDLDSRIRQMTILNEYLQEVALLGVGDTLASEDELTRGIINICEGARGGFENKADTVHLWIVFGLQLFLDTQKRLGNRLYFVLFLPCLLLEQGQPWN